eukprot:602195-Amphidinium_carterae.1
MSALSLQALEEQQEWIAKQLEPLATKYCSVDVSESLHARTQEADREIRHERAPHEYEQRNKLEVVK